MSVTAALEATRDDAGALKPAMLLFQLGPVQEFIAQARSTRDLWSGSYLLSWLMAHAMQAVAERFGPDSIVFPSLRGQPLFDWLNREKLQRAAYPGSSSYWDHLQGPGFQDAVLTPNLPNRFLAVVHADFDPNGVVQALETEWGKISEACKNWLAGKGHSVKHSDRWDAQVARFWQPAWQLWPWQDIEKTVELFNQLPATPPKKKDKPDDPDPFDMDIFSKILAGGQYSAKPGNFWFSHYQLCQHRLDARRQTRDFSAWKGVENAAKDDYSGRE